MEKEKLRRINLGVDRIALLFGELKQLNKEKEVRDWDREIKEIIARGKATARNKKLKEMHENEKQLKRKRNNEN